MAEEFLTAVSDFAPGRLDKSCVDRLPLAMSYVPMQKWQDIYENDVGFARGTIFSQLDKPFLGRRAIDE